MDRLYNLLNNYNENKRRKHQDSKKKDVSIVEMLEDCRSLKDDLLNGCELFPIKTMPMDQGDETNYWLHQAPKDYGKIYLPLRLVDDLMEVIQEYLKLKPEEIVFLQMKVVRITAL